MIIDVATKELIEALMPLLKHGSRGSAVTGKCASAGTTIGKRYARTDELGIPFAITVDRDTLDAGPKQGTVTVRERDSTAQARPCTVRAPLSSDTATHALTWLPAGLIWLRPRNCTRPSHAHDSWRQGWSGQRKHELVGCR